jgi:hypothetical protein
MDHHQSRLLALLLAPALAGSIFGQAISSKSPEKPSAANTLRWKLQTGDNLSLEVSRVTESTTKSDATEFSDRFEQITDEHWKVLSVDQLGVATIRQTFERIRGTVEGSDGTRRYDSAASENPIISDPEILYLKTLLGATFTFVMDSSGQITEAHADTRTISLFQQDSLASRASWISPHGIEQTLKQVIPTFPKSALVKGDTWKDTVEVKSTGGNYTMRVIFTYVEPVVYRGVTVEKIILDATRVLRDFTTPGGIEAQVLQEENPGVVYFDNEQGRLVETELRQKATLSATHNGHSAVEKVNVVSRIRISGQKR